MVGGCALARPSEELPENSAFWEEATMDRREFVKTSAAAMAAVAVTKSARAATSKTIDAQVHSYERNHPERPWAGTLVGPDEMTGDQMVAAMDAVGVDAAVLVSPFAFYRYDPSYVLEVEAKHPDRFCLVKPVDPNDPAIAENIADWKSKKGTVGVRLLFQDSFATDPADPGLNRVLAAAAKNSLAVNVQAPTRLDQIAQLVARNPDTQIVIDHLGLMQPFEPPASPEPWANLPKVLALAKYPNVAIKITGACTLSHEPFPYKDIWEPLDRIFSAFTLDRCLWGTDWTRAIKILTYKQGVDAFRMNDKLSDSDKAKLMGGTASKIYKWSPPGKA
jgi:L-fuconolactonase